MGFIEHPALEPFCQWSGAGTFGVDGLRRAFLAVPFAFLFPSSLLLCAAAPNALPLSRMLDQACVT